MKTHEALSL